VSAPDTGVTGEVGPAVGRDPERMRSALRTWLPGGCRLTAVVPLSTGHSNETYLLEGLDAVLRMPPVHEGLLPPYDMAAQHALLAQISVCAEGPPVPRVRELCLDRAILGAAFFIMDRAPGTSFDHPHVPAWLLAADAATRSSMCAQWLDAVVAVSRIPVARMVGVPHRAPDEEASHWLTVAESAQAPAALLNVLADLVAAPPPSSGPPTSVHGDTRHANCLWHEAQLTALVDWELAGVGDPMLDLGNTVAYFPDGVTPLVTAGFDLAGWWERGRVIEAWERGTGRTADGLARWEGLAMARLAAILAVGAQLHREGRARDARFAVWAETLPLYVQLIEVRLQL